MFSKVKAKISEWVKGFQQKKGPDTLCRRIYIGDVPYLRKSDGDVERSLFQQTEQTQVRRKSLRPEPPRSHLQVDDEYEDDETRIPKNIRRASVARDNPAANRDGADLPEKFSTNLVMTSRYTVWNFIPKNLFEQFRRIVNFYFFIIALIQAVIDTPVHPVTAVSPLAFVIAVTAIKQGYEDWLRHKNDDQVNNRIVRVIKNGKIVKTKSKDVQVGDIVQLEGDEQVPTDILLICSSDQFSRCQINTANLDGETNLKLRYCPSGLPRFKSSEDFQHLHIIVECEQPCEDLYEFNGSLLIPANKLEEMHSISGPSHAVNVSSTASLFGDQETSHHEFDFTSGMIRQGMTDFLSIPLSMENMLLRGTRLKNTNSITGIVIYTGRDTRLAKNSEKSESKFSTVERTVNYYLVFFIGILIVLVSFCTWMHHGVKWFPTVEDDDRPWYASDDISKSRKSSSAKHVSNTVASFIVLFNYIIPISLYVTVETQKFMGSKFFVWDKEMADDEGREPLCNTSDLNEELGQIEYLFSDKTGTLTQNLMKFRHCSINAFLYEFKDEQLYSLRSVGSQDRFDASKVVDLRQTPNVLEFFKTLALCHSVQVVPKRRPSFDVTDIPLTPDSYGKDKVSDRRSSLITPELSQVEVSFKEGNWEFQASSPDEKALLESCETLGIVYRGEKEDVMMLDVFGSVEKYKRLMHLEFDAERKCMSVIIENAKGEIWLLTKGAESSIIQKCDNGPKQVTLNHIVDYALMGLRTLAVAVRKLTSKDYEDFASELRAAGRLFKNRQARVREVYNGIETRMTLIGATGVEDQLQDNVPETLQSFSAAGIRVWMLTGDKLETGVNVAVSCGLITASTKQHVVNKISDAKEIKEKLTQIKKDIDPSDNTCFVVDGESLALAFKECPILLRDVSMAAFRVVCCRMAPLQKAQVVQMVKNSPKRPTCCAVGDGANDCAMILAAHIGIGILGKEGRQAARCADFAIAKFGFLKKAILVHGHWYYVRVANLANYFFYKNVVFVMPQFFFSFNSNFSTQALYNGLFLMNYNILFSSCPIFFYGLTEQSYPADTLMQQPHLYKKNYKNALMSMREFPPWLISSLWHAAVCYYLPYFSWGNFAQIDNLATFGTVVFTGVVVTSNMKMAIETRYVTLLSVYAHITSYVCFFGLALLFSEVDFSILGFNTGIYHHVFSTVLGSTCFWLVILLVTVVSISLDITYASIKNSWKDIVKLFRGSKVEGLNCVQ